MAIAQETVDPVGEVSAPRSRRALVAGSVGNFIEWYEFGAYGFLATIMASNFFSAGSGTDLESLIKTYAAFALAFFFRPVGAALFGRVGDRIGRRPTLIMVLLLMSGATTLIGVLPTYATIGIAAPVLLTLVRILQGLSAGGEFGGAVSVMTEFAPRGRRGLFGSWQSFTVALGLLTAAGISAILATALTPEQLGDWGWRVPFLLALPMGLVALWLRLKLEETPSFQRVEKSVSASAVDSHPEALGDAHREAHSSAHGPGHGSAPAVVTSPGIAELTRTIALGIGRLMGWSAAGYTFLVVMPSYLQTSLNATFQQALLATVLANVGFALTILPAGLLSDRVGRRPVMVTGVMLILLLALPLLNLLQNPDGALPVKGLAVLLAGAAVGLIAGPGPAMLSEMFPTTVRYTGLGLSYSLSNAVFAGSAGLIITSLIKSTKNLDIPAYYVMFTCAISAVALLTLRGDDHQRDLED